MKLNYMKNNVAKMLFGVITTFFGSYLTATTFKDLVSGEILSSEKLIERHELTPEKVKLGLENALQTLKNLNQIAKDPKNPQEIEFFQELKEKFIPTILAYGGAIIDSELKKKSEDRIDVWYFICLKKQIQAALEDKFDDIDKIAKEYEEDKKREEECKRNMEGLSALVTQVKGIGEDVKQANQFGSSFMNWVFGGNAIADARKKEPLRIEYLQTPGSSSASTGSSAERGNSPRQPQSTDQQPSSSWW